MCVCVRALKIPALRNFYSFFSFTRLACLFFGFTHSFRREKKTYKDILSFAAFSSSFALVFFFKFNWLPRDNIACCSNNFEPVKSRCSLMSLFQLAPFCRSSSFSSFSLRLFFSLTHSVFICFFVILNSPETRGNNTKC